MHSLRTSRIVCAIVLSSLTLGAQSVGITTGDLKGRVWFSEAKKAVPGVVLSLLNLATGETRILKSDDRGEYGFRVVPAGIYTLTVEAPGYATRKLRNVQVLIGTVSLLDVELSTGSQGYVEVVAEAPGADPQRTQVSRVIDPMLIDNLPINRRSFVDFSLTVPGVALSNTPVTGGVPTSGLTFRGMNPRQNRFLIDGLDNNDLGTGAVGCPISQGAVQEFQVVTGALPAEYGRLSGGVVNSILKSGGNETTGSVFAFYRPGQWDARSADGGDHSEFHQEQFGASLGGAIIPDRLFYFASVERFRKSDVKTVDIDPVFALPSIAAAGFLVQDGPQPVEETETTALVKLDYLPSPSHKWSFRLSTGQDTKEDQIPWGDIIARSAGGTLDKRNTQLAVSHQWLGSERWINEARFMYAKENSSLQSMDSTGGVSVDITGVAQFGTQRLTPQDLHTDYFQLADTATFSLGNHVLKVGVDLLHSKNHGTVDQNTSGVYVFQPLPGLFSDSLTAFNAGFPSAYLQSWGDPTTSFNADSNALFLQDDWQIHPRFLLKAGLRYDWERLPAFDDSAYWDLQNPPATVDPILGPTRLPSAFFAEQFKTQKDWSSSRLSPRISGSWQVSDPVRVYGGYGVYSGSTQLGSLFGPRLYNNRDTQTYLYTFLDDLPRLLTLQPPLLPGFWFVPGHVLPFPPPGYKPVMVIPGSYGMPETKSWNLGMEWVPRPNHRLTLDLIYSRGSGFMNVRDVNAYVLYNGIPRRPDLRYSQILRIDGSGESRYWGQTIAWQWTVNDALSLALSYTHGKAEDNYTDWAPDFPLQNPFDPSQEWGPSAEDQTHQVQLSGVYRTRSQHPLLRNWTVSVIAQWASGRPYSQLVGYDLNVNGDGSSDRPSGVGRNSERGPAIKTVDLRLARELKLKKVRLECLLEIFNLFNSANVLKVQNILSAPAPHAYGSALAFGPSRQFQFGVKATF
jgi:outer membrane receptor protein involved in Fe transport